MVNLGGAYGKNAIFPPLLTNWCLLNPTLPSKFIPSHETIMRQLCMKDLKCRKTWKLVKHWWVWSILVGAYGKNAIFPPLLTNWCLLNPTLPSKFIPQHETIMGQLYMKDLKCRKTWKLVKRWWVWSILVGMVENAPYFPSSGELAPFQPLLYLSKFILWHETITGQLYMKDLKSRKT